MMRIPCLLAAAVTASCALVLVYQASAQTKSTAPTTIAPSASTRATGGATTPIVEERADQLLKQMGAYIGSAEQFTFHADVTFDHVLPSGQKLQFAAIEDAA